MAYATLDDVLSYTGRAARLQAPSSPISTAEVDGFIDDIAAEVDALLQSIGVSLPVDLAGAPTAARLLKRLNVLGAAAQLELRLFGEAVPGASARDSRGALYRQQYDNLFTQLRDGSLALADIASAPESDSNSAFSGSTKNAATGSTNEPFFTRDQEF